jgi:hypothetical protein
MRGYKKGSKNKSLIKYFYKERVVFSEIKMGCHHQNQ